MGEQWRNGGRRGKNERMWWWRMIGGEKRVKVFGVQKAFFSSSPYPSPPKRYQMPAEPVDRDYMSSTDSKGRINGGEKE